MEKVINVDGKDVKFKSTAGTLIRYRNNFGRDLLKDIMKLKTKFDKVENTEEQFETMDLELFEKIAWVMAKTADDSLPSIETWLDDFETFAITKILPEIMNLLVGNMQQEIDSKKKLQKVVTHKK